MSLHKDPLLDIGVSSTGAKFDSRLLSNLPPIVADFQKDLTIYIVRSYSSADILLLPSIVMLGIVGWMSWKLVGRA